MPCSLYLIAYDIASPKRLQRVHRYLTDNAIPLQNSTFLFTASHTAGPNSPASSTAAKTTSAPIRCQPTACASNSAAKSRKAFTAYDHLHAQPNKKTAKPTIDAT